VNGLKQSTSPENMKTTLTRQTLRNLQQRASNPVNYLDNKVTKL